MLRQVPESAEVNGSPDINHACRLICQKQEGRHSTDGLQQRALPLHLKAILFSPIRI